MFIVNCYLVSRVASFTNQVELAYLFYPVLLFTPSLMSHGLCMPIGAFGFSFPYLAASSPLPLPAPVYTVGAIII